MHPEQLHIKPNPQHIDDGSSIFAGDNPRLRPYQLAENYPASTKEASLVHKQPSDSIMYATRFMLINNPGLLQDDTAEALDISLYALEQCSEKPEEVVLESDSKDLLLKSHLGGIALARKAYREKMGYKHDLSIEYNLDPFDIRLMHFLHLSHDDAANALKTNRKALTTQTARLCKKLELDNRIQLAMFAYNHGVPFELDTLDATEFTLRERLYMSHVASLKPRELAEKQGLTPKQVNTITKSLYIKTGANHRRHLALIIAKNGLAASEDEVVNYGLEILRPFSLKQKFIALNVHLPKKDLIALTSSTKSYVNQVLFQIRRELGCHNDAELAFLLESEGAKLNTNKPKGDIVELLTAEQLQACRLSHKSIQDAATELGIKPKSVSSYLYLSKRNLGARTNVELALMMKRYDTGKNKEPIYKPRLELLSQRLGFKVRDIEHARSLFKLATDAQSKCLEAYYVDGISWQQVADTNGGLDRATPIKNSARGIKQIQDRRTK